MLFNWYIIISEIKTLILYSDKEKANLKSIIIPNINVCEISPININYGGATTFNLIVENSNYLNEVILILSLIKYQTQL